MTPKDRLDELAAAPPFTIVAAFLASRAVAQGDDATAAALEALREPRMHATGTAPHDPDLARAALRLEEVERQAWAVLIATCAFAADAEALRLVEAALRRRVGH